MNRSSPVTLDGLLADYRANALTRRDQGTAFERLAKAWLTRDPVQGQRLEQVETYTEWARREGRDADDLGTDLVGTLAKGGLVAIQCKFLEPDHRIRKEDIDSFLAHSGKGVFTERMIVETTEVPWSDNAEEMLRGQDPPVCRIGLRDLRESEVDWFQFAGTGRTAKAKLKTLRPDQKRALKAVVEGLQDSNRGCSSWPAAPTRPSPHCGLRRRWLVPLGVSST